MGYWNPDWDLPSRASLLQVPEGLHVKVSLSHFLTYPAGCYVSFIVKYGTVYCTLPSHNNAVPFIVKYNVKYVTFTQ